MGIAGKSGQKITPVVCDTGPVLHLMEAGLLHLLKEAGKIYIPNSVEAELVEISPQWGKERPRWITIKVLTLNEAKEAEFLFLSGLLDLGEAEAIMLSKRLKAKWLLTDDTEARMFAASLGIEVHGSLGIVLWSAATGHLSYSEAMEAIDRLSRTSLWISKHIISEAQKALQKMFGKE